MVLRAVWEIYIAEKGGYRVQVDARGKLGGIMEEERGKGVRVVT